MYSIRYYIGIKNDGNKNYVTAQKMLMTMLYEIADLKLHLCYGYSLCLHKYRNRKEMGKIFAGYYIREVWEEVRM